MRVFLLRHAESVANERRIWTGQMDSGLSERGAAELLRICSRYAYPEGGVYFSSPLKRCLATLQIVYGRTADYVLPEFTECSLGSLEGREYTSLDDDANYIAWIENRGLRPHGGESFGEFTARVRRGFSRMIRICREAGVSSAVAALHGNVMRAILSGFVDASRPHELWEIPNCGGYIFDFETILRPPRYKRIPEFLFPPVVDKRL